MEQRRRIAQVITTPGGAIGAIEQHTFELCAALAEKNEVHLLADRPYSASCPKGVIFHPLEFSKSALNPLLYWQLAQTLNHIQPHVVHAQTAKAVKLLRRLVWFFQHMVFVATAHNPQKNWQAFGAMNGVIVTNTPMANHFAADKVRVIYPASIPAVELSVRDKKQLKESLLAGHQQPLLLAIGRLTPNKAFDVLLRALVGVDARLVIVGDGMERHSLEYLCRELGLSEQVVFAGRRHNETAFLQVADLCVVSSRYERFSSVVMDALANGCPVISTKVAGANEWLPEALLVPPNNVEALHSLLCVTLKRLPMIRRNYLPIFLRARQELAVTGMAERTQDFYDDLLEQHQ